MERIRHVYFRAIQRMCSCQSGARYRQLQTLAAYLANRMAASDKLNLFDTEVL
jgi:hypothetical protein